MRMLTATFIVAAVSALSPLDKAIADTAISSGEVYRFIGTTYTALKLCRLNPPTHAIRLMMDMIGDGPSGMDSNDAIAQNEAKRSRQQAEREGVAIWCAKMAKTYEDLER